MKGLWTYPNEQVEIWFDFFQEASPPTPLPTPAPTHSPTLSPIPTPPPLPPGKSVDIPLRFEMKDENGVLVPIILGDVLLEDVKVEEDEGGGDNSK